MPVPRSVEGRFQRERANLVAVAAGRQVQRALGYRALSMSGTHVQDRIVMGQLIAARPNLRAEKRTAADDGVVPELPERVVPVIRVVIAGQNGGCGSAAHRILTRHFIASPVNRGVKRAERAKPNASGSVEVRKV